MDSKPLVFMCLAVVSGLAFTTLEGCDLKQAVKINPPGAVRDVLNLKGRTSLADAETIWNKWEQFVTSETELLRSEISSAEHRYEVIRDLFSVSLGALDQHAAGLPGGLLITSALAGVGGLFLNKPGAKKKIREVQAKSFRQGMAVERAHHKSDK